MTALPTEVDFYDADDVPVTVRALADDRFEVLAWNSPDPRPYPGGYSKLLNVGIVRLSREEFVEFVRRCGYEHGS